MREIPLTQGKVALVDDTDYEELARFKWYARRSGKTWYACRYGGGGRSGQVEVRMHRQIMGDPVGMLVDHRDGDGLNCQRSNLREATQGQNSTNRSKPVSGLSSRYKGVTWDKQWECWKARVTHNNIVYHCGNFEKEEDAARAYDDKARAVQGPFARTNFTPLPLSEGV
jgi:hypothetical protein